MRILRMICCLVLGALLCLFLIYILGWKVEKPAVLLVGSPDPTNVIPILQKGQVLRWERAAGKPFTIKWLNGASPCKDLVIPSHSSGGKETASCEVETPPTTSPYQYGIKNGNERNMVILNLVPCNGCIFYPPNVAGDYVATKTTGLTSSLPFITISCISGADGGSVYNDTPFIQAPSDPTKSLTWLHGADITIDSPVFQNPSGVTCTTASGGDYTCTFSSTVVYPNKYTIKATGIVAGSNPAPYCGANQSTTGMGAGEVDAP